MGIVGFESRIVDSHDVITGLIHRAVVGVGVGGAVLKDLILDPLIICSRLKIWIR